MDTSRKAVTGSLSWRCALKRCVLLASMFPFLYDDCDSVCLCSALNRIDKSLLPRDLLESACMKHWASLILLKLLTDSWIIFCIYIYSSKVTEYMREREAEANVALSLPWLTVIVPRHETPETPCAWCSKHQRVRKTEKEQRWNDKLN